VIRKSQQICIKNSPVRLNGWDYKFGIAAIVCTYFQSDQILLLSIRSGGKLVIILQFYVTVYSSLAGIRSDLYFFQVSESLWRLQRHFTAASAATCCHQKASTISCCGTTLDASRKSASAPRSADHGQYDVPRVSSSVGSRAFSVAGPRAWNQLPSLRQRDCIEIKCFYY